MKMPSRSLGIPALLALVTLIFVLTAPAPASADLSVTPLPPGHTWKYTFIDPTGDSTWNTTTGGWTTGPAPFGNDGPGTLFDPGTVWPADIGHVLVNIDATKDLAVDGVFSVDLPPGSYGLTVVGIGGGGAFDAWNAWSTTTPAECVNPACATGWQTQYAFTSPSLGVQVAENNGIYSTATLALGAVSSGTGIALPAAETVRFWIPDCGGCHLDNLGCVSVLITRVPGDDLWVRTAVDLTGIDLSSADWGLGVDNGFKLYANGVLVGSGNAEGYTFRWEYTGGFGTALVPATNVIAVALEDHGGATAFDMVFNAKLIDTDGDGVADCDDNFPSSNIDPNVGIGDCDSGVGNQTMDDGYTFNDLIGAISARNHGDYVKQVTKLADSWKKDGLISGRDKGKITSCAAQSDLP